MNARHLTPEERQALLAITENAGPVETLRTLAQIINQQIADLGQAEVTRLELNAIAKRIAGMELR